MKSLLIQLLLRCLNSRFLNASPCQYGYIGNVDAFAYGHLQSEDRQRPGITVRQILDEADRFRLCPMHRTGVTVIEGDMTREADMWDYNELRNLGDQ